jgi:hypothetical protein
VKLPKSVNVLGHDYSVTIVDQKKLPSPSTSAICRYPQREIWICKDLGKELRWLNFLHELRHAFQFEAGLTQILTAQMCEVDCEQFASFIQSLQNQKVI